MKFAHVPVLLKETVAYLNPQPNENFIDCTLGGGGHAKEILAKTTPQGKLLGIDLDLAAIEAATQNLMEFSPRFTLINGNYIDLKKIVYDAGFNQINGMLLDLGLSSYELQDSDRGFSFQGSAFLDMRFGGDGQTAADILKSYREEDLARIFKEYGEERHARLIAGEIVKERRLKSITETDELVKIIANVYKNKPKPRNIHIATKVFQALRIEVNKELENLQQVLPEALEILGVGGRLAVISFHSLEDKIVKKFFQREAKECLCPPKLPVCVCNHKPRIKILTNKAIVPSRTEIQNNPRSRSARLRAFQKLK